MRARDQFLISSTKTGKVGRYHMMFRNVTEITRKRDGRWLIRNHEKEQSIHLKKVANLTFLGLDPKIAIPVQFLDALNAEHVALILSDLSAEKYQILAPQFTHGIDHLTGLHEIRRSQKKSAHIARELIKAQVANRRFEIPDDLSVKLTAAQDIAIVRAIEAELANRYWKHYFYQLGLYQEHRRGSGPVQEALNVTALHLTQVVSRHLLNHRLPLEYGIMHLNTYSHCLVYDLMEPFRGFTEQAVANAYQKGFREEALTQEALAILTQTLETYFTYRQGPEKKSLQQLIELTIMNLIDYGNAQLQQDGASTRFWVPKLGRRKFARTPVQTRTGNTVTCF